MGYIVGADGLQTIDESEFEVTGGVWDKCDTTNLNANCIKFNVAQIFV